MNDDNGKDSKRLDCDTVRMDLQVVMGGDGWRWSFSGAPGVLLDEEGTLKFTRKDAMTVEIAIRNSPGVSFLPTADRCIAFDKAICPTTSDKKDKDVFSNIRVNPELDTLSFINHNRKGLFYYALFATAGGVEISHDPVIINKAA